VGASFDNYQSQTPDICLRESILGEALSLPPRNLLLERSEPQHANRSPAKLIPAGYLTPHHHRNRQVVAKTPPNKFLIAPRPSKPNLRACRCHIVEVAHGNYRHVLARVRGDATDPIGEGLGGERTIGARGLYTPRFVTANGYR